MKLGNLFLSVVLALSVITPLYSTDVQAKKDGFEKVEIDQDFSNIYKVYNNDRSDYWYVTTARDSNLKGLLDSEYKTILDPEWNNVVFDPKLDTMTMSMNYMPNTRASYTNTKTYQNGIVIESEQGVNVIECEFGEYTCQYYYQDEYILQKKGEYDTERVGYWKIEDDYKLYTAEGEYILSASEVLKNGGLKYGEYDLVLNSEYPEYVQISDGGDSLLVKLDEDNRIVESFYNRIMPKEGEGLFFDVENRKYLEYKNNDFNEYELVFLPCSDMVDGKAFVIEEIEGQQFGNLYIYDYYQNSYENTEVMVDKNHDDVIKSGAFIVEDNNEDFVLVSLSGRSLNITELLEEELNKDSLVGEIDHSEYRNVINRFVYDNGANDSAYVYVSTQNFDYKVVKEPIYQINFDSLIVSGGTLNDTAYTSVSFDAGHTSFDYGTSYVSVNSPVRNANGNIVFYHGIENGKTEVYELVETTDTNTLKYVEMIDLVSEEELYVPTKAQMMIFGETGKIVDYSDKEVYSLNSPHTIDGSETLFINTEYLIEKDGKYFNMVGVEVYDVNGSKLYSNVGKEYNGIPYVVNILNSGAEYAKAINSNEKDSFFVEVRYIHSGDDGTDVEHGYALMDEQFNFITDTLYYNYTDLYSRGFEGLYEIAYNGQTGIMNDEGEFVVPLGFYEVMVTSTKNGKRYYIANANEYESDSYVFDANGEKILTFQGYADGIKNNVSKDHIILTFNGHDVLFKKHGNAPVLDGWDVVDGFTTKGLSKACVGNKCGFVNGEGSVVIPREYDEALSFYENQAFVKKDDEWFVIDHKNNRKDVTIGDPEKTVIDVEHFDEKYVNVTYDDGTSALVHRGTLEEVGINGTDIQMVANDGENAYVRVESGASTFSLRRTAVAPEWYVMDISEETEQTPYTDDVSEGDNNENEDDSYTENEYGFKKVMFEHDFRNVTKVYDNDYENYWYVTEISDKEYPFGENGPYYLDSTFALYTSNYRKVLGFEWNQIEWKGELNAFEIAKEHTPSRVIANEPEPSIIRHFYDNSLVLNSGEENGEYKIIACNDSNEEYQCKYEKREGYYIQTKYTYDSELAGWKKVDGYTLYSEEGDRLPDFETDELILNPAYPTWAIISGKTVQAVEENGQTTIVEYPDLRMPKDGEGLFFNEVDGKYYEVVADELEEYELADDFIPYSDMTNGKTFVLAPKHETANIMILDYEDNGRVADTGLSVSYKAGRPQQTSLAGETIAIYDINNNYDLVILNLDGKSINVQDKFEMVLSDHDFDKEPIDYTYVDDIGYQCSVGDIYLYVFTDSFQTKLVEDSSEVIDLNKVAIIEDVMFENINKQFSDPESEETTTRPSHNVYASGGEVMFSSTNSNFSISIEDFTDFIKASHSDDKNSFVVNTYIPSSQENEWKVGRYYSIVDEDFKILNQQNYYHLESLYDDLGIDAYLTTYQSKNSVVRVIENNGSLELLELLPLEGYENGTIRNFVFPNDSVLSVAYSIEEQQYVFYLDGKRLFGFKGNFLDIKGDIFDDHLVISAEDGDYLFGFGKETPIIEKSELGGFTSKGLSKHCKNSKCGYINKNGKKAVDYEYDEALEFYENQAFVKKDDEWFVIDHKNKKKNVTIGDAEKKVVDVNHFDKKYVTVTYDDGTSALVHRGSLKEVGIYGTDIQLVTNDGESAYVRVESGASTFSLRRTAVAPEWYVMDISEEAEQEVYETSWTINVGDQSEVRINSDNGTFGRFKINDSLLTESNNDISYNSTTKELTINESFFEGILPNGQYRIGSETITVTNGVEVSMYHTPDMIVLKYEDTVTRNKQLEELDAVYVQANNEIVDKVIKDNSLYESKGETEIVIHKANLVSNKEVTDSLGSNTIVDMIIAPYNTVSDYWYFWTWANDYEFELANEIYSVSESTITLPKGYYATGDYEIGALCEESEDYILFTTFSLTEADVKQLVTKDLSISITPKFDCGGSSFVVVNGINNFEPYPGFWDWTFDVSNLDSFWIQNENTYGSIDFTNLGNDRTIKYDSDLKTLHIANEFFKELPNGRYIINDQEVVITYNYDVKASQTYDRVIFKYSDENTRNAQKQEIDHLYIHLNQGDVQVRIPANGLLKEGNNNDLYVLKSDILNSTEVKNLGITVNDMLVGAWNSVTDYYRFWTFATDYEFTEPNTVLLNNTITLPKGYYQSGTYEVGAHWDDSEDLYLLTSFRLSSEDVAKLLTGPFTVNVKTKFECYDSMLEFKYGIGNFKGTNEPLSPIEIPEMDGPFLHSNDILYIDGTNMEHVFFVGPNTAGSIRFNFILPHMADQIRIVEQNNKKILVVSVEFLEQHLPAGKYIFSDGNDETVDLGTVILDSNIEILVTENDKSITYKFDTEEAYNDQKSMLDHIYVNVLIDTQNNGPESFSSAHLELDRYLTYNDQDNSFKISKDVLNHMEHIPVWYNASIRSYHMTTDNALVFWHYADGDRWLDYFTANDLPRFDYSTDPNTIKIRVFDSENVIFKSKNTSGEINVKTIIENEVAGTIEYDENTYELIVSKDYLESILPEGDYEFIIRDEKSKKIKINGLDQEIIETPNSFEFKYTNKDDYDTAINSYSGLVVEVLANNKKWQNTQYSKDSEEFAKYVKFDDTNLTYTISKDVMTKIDGKYRMSMINNTHTFTGIIYGNKTDHYKKDDKDKKAPRKETVTPVYTYELNTDVIYEFDFDEDLNQIQTECTLSHDIPCTVNINKDKVTVSFKTPEIQNTTIELESLTVQDISGNKLDLKGTVLAKTVYEVEKKSTSTVAPTDEIDNVYVQSTHKEFDVKNQNRIPEEALDELKNANIILSVREQNNNNAKKEFNELDGLDIKDVDTIVAYNLRLLANVTHDNKDYVVDVEPKSGKEVTVYIPYPENYDKDSSKVSIYHYVDGKYVEMKVELTEQGLKIITDSFSPFLLVSTAEYTPEDDNDEPTDDPSDNQGGSGTTPGGSGSGGSSGGSSGGGGGGGSSSAEVPTTPQTTIPTTTIVKALRQQDTVTIKVTKPQTVSSTILKAIKDTDKEITIEVVDSNKEVVYSYTIKGKDVTEAKSFDLGISTTTEHESTLKTLVNKTYEVIDFKHEGTLPANMWIKIKTNYKPSDKVHLMYFNETKKQLETVQENITIKDGYAYIQRNRCSTYLLVLESSLDLSEYTDELLPVYDNSRATNITLTSKGFKVDGYAFINGKNFDKKDSLWREIIFVNEEDTSRAKAYRMQVTSQYNTFLNSNKNINPTGTLSYAYANYTVQVDPDSIKDYLTNSKYQKMAKGSYRVYIRVSDGVHGKLFPLKDIVLSDGSTLTLPSGFELVDTTTRELRYIVK